MSYKVKYNLGSVDEKVKIPHGRRVEFEVC